MNTTKRQTKFSLSRDREISEIAAQLLRYLKPGSAEQRERAGAADFAPATRGSSGTGPEPIREVRRSRGAVLEPLQMPQSNASAAWSMAEQGAPEPLGDMHQELMRDLSTMPLRTFSALPAQELRNFSFPAEAAQGLTAELPVPQQRPAAPTQQTMDDLSEFFRRDSRRYDRVFSGGNGA